MTSKKADTPCSGTGILLALLERLFAFASLLEMQS
jgi:hypothetical protein